MYQWRLLRLMHWFHSVMVWEAMIGAFKQKKNQPTMPLCHSPPQVLLVLIMRKSQFDVLSYKIGLESVEARLLVYQQNKTIFEEDVKLLKFDVELRDNALVALKKKFEKAEQEREELKLKLENFQTFSKNLSQLLASQTNDKTRLGTNQGYHVVPPPYTRTFMPPKPDLFFHDAPNVNETIHTAFNVELNPTKPNKDLSQSNRPSAPLIEDWVSDSKDDSEGELIHTQINPSFVYPTDQVKNPRPSVEHPIPAANLKTEIPKSRGYGNNRNRKACFVCKSLTHLIKDCDYYKQKMVQKLVWNHAMRGNHQHYAQMSYPNPQRHVIPTAVLTRSKLVPLPTARPVTNAVSHNNVIRPRPAKTVGT
uniref:Uncharacterized protein n=1 Tax=Tanacetum cinerariifolium TaxID=118510 RepID=A0A699JN95_TANCI|nr:hypothetical protein [Tanacetum cinerariifolium]